MFRIVLRWYGLIFLNFNGSFVRNYSLWIEVGVLFLEICSGVFFRK